LAQIGNASQPMERVKFEALPGDNLMSAFSICATRARVFVWRANLMVVIPAGFESVDLLDTILGPANTGQPPPCPGG
jgi:hypothetical protein